MRTLDDAFAAHLASRATTLCWCWRIVRRDGVVLGFTDHDETIAFDGTAFAPATGLEGGGAVERLGPQVQTAEVLGILDHEGISETDIGLGRYDGAQVESWRVNWRAPDQRALVRADAIGEIVREDGMFRAELRSAQHAMNRVSGRAYQHVCDARLGDARCGVDLAAEGLARSATVAAVAGATVSVAGLAGLPDGWADHGRVRWTGGTRAGVVDGIASQAGGVLHLVRVLADTVSVGDTLVVSAGCDRTFATCRERFGNGVNFRGFPHIPGADAMLRYPTETDALDGAVRVR